MLPFSFFLNIENDAMIVNKSINTRISNTLSWIHGDLVTFLMICFEC